MKHQHMAHVRASERVSAPKSADAFAAMSRYAYLDALRVMRRELGLSAQDLSVMSALLSFLPLRGQDGIEGPIRPDMMLVIFASNASICARCHDIDERVLRRHIARLVTAGLVQRRDSATKKRFPLRENGRIADAFGIDLRPGLFRGRDLMARAKQLQDEHEEARSVRARILAYRQELLHTGEKLSPDLAIKVEDIKAWLRRKLTLKDLRAALDWIKSFARHAVAPVDSAPSLTGSDTPPGTHRSSTAPADTPETSLPGSPVYSSRPRTASCARAPDQANRKNVQHLQPTPAVDIASSNIRKRCSRVGTTKESAADGHNVRAGVHEIDLLSKGLQAWPNIQQFFPEPPRNRSDLDEILFLLGKMMKIDLVDVARYTAKIGPEAVLKVFDYLIAHAEKISSPKAYLAAVVRDPARLSKMRRGTA